jgi:hypothetical protein
LKTDILANQYIVDLIELDSQPNEIGLSLHRRKLGADSFASYMMDAHVVIGPYTFLCVVSFILHFLVSSLFPLPEERKCVDVVLDLKDLSAVIPEHLQMTCAGCGNWRPRLPLDHLPRTCTECHHRPCTIFKHHTMWDIRLLRHECGKAVECRNWHFW